jgi:hypothetical protein
MDSESVDLVYEFAAMLREMTPDEVARLCREGLAMNDAHSVQKNACITDTRMAQFCYLDDSQPANHGERRINDRSIAA